MRTCGLVLLCTNFTLVVLFHAFMCDKMRVRSAAGGLSRKPTVRFTPFVCQNFVGATEMAALVGLNPGTIIATLSSRGRFTGLISVAILAAESHRFRGNCLG